MRAREAMLVRRLLLVVAFVVAIGIPSVGMLASPRAAADTSCPTSNPPDELTLGGGTPQTAQLSTAFGSPLQVVLANSNGCPVTSVVGTPVTFTAPPSGASGSFATSGTNAVTVGADLTGNASAPAFSANDTAGSYIVIASSAYGSISFSLTNSAAGIPATITSLSSAPQSATVNSAFAQQLSVRVLDADRSPVSGATVTFTLGVASASAVSGGPSAGASFANGTPQATATTDSQGTATSPPFTANTTIGRFTATAAVGNLPQPAQFQLENLPGKGERLTRLGPARRTATVEHRYRRSLRVLVRDANGNPEIGATVTFTLGAAGGVGTGGGTGTSGGAGAGASFADGTNTATATTSVDGIATSPSIIAGTVAGTFTATATTATTTRAVLFTLRNRAGKPAMIGAGIAASEATQAGTRFAIALAVTVTDAVGNKVLGALVTFTAPVSGASGSFDTRTHQRVVAIRTDSQGIAVAPPFIANGQPGGYVVIAAVRHGPRTAFALVNNAP